MGQELEFSDVPIIRPNQTPKELAKQESISREKARELVRAYYREEELDLEATLPSGDEHLNNSINGPLLKAIRRLEDDNERLLDIANGGGSENELMTKVEAREAYADNIALLLDIKKNLKLSKNDNSNVNLTVDLGNVFHAAKDAAREAMDHEKEFLIRKENG